MGPLDNLVPQSFLDLLLSRVFSPDLTWWTLSITATHERNYPVMMGINLMFAVFLFAENIIADTSYALRTPGSHGGREEKRKERIWNHPG